MIDAPGAPTRSTNGQVATPHALASSAGLDALRDGGSAVDAAVAANAVLCVAYPHMTGLGGDGFWLLSHPDDGRRAINASGPAAAAATRSYYGDADAIPERGAEAALTVPGVVDGWRLAHEAYGRLEWERLFDDAVALAAEGVPVTERVARWIRRDRDVLAADDRARATFLVGGDPPSPGTRLEQPALASSLSCVAEAGPRAFYEGELGAAFCAAIEERGSPLRPADLADYAAEWVDPLSVSYRGYTAHALPPNTQGVAALELLGLLEGCDVAGWGDGTADYFHHMAEATKLAFADRDAWVTDPAAVEAPTGTLLSEPYLAERRDLIDPGRALPARPEPGVHPPERRPARESAGGDTCYCAAVDEDGLAVSVIASIYHDFGSGVVAGGTGIVPQNRGASFSLDPAHVNSLEPGKRPFHTLAPAMLTADGEPRLVYGTMGGEGQPQTQAALVSRVVDYGYDVQRAIDAPRWLFGRTWGERSRTLSVERRVPDRVLADLEDRGHDVSIARAYDARMGHAQAIRVHPDGTLEGGADPRGDGAALGY